MFFRGERGLPRDDTSNRRARVLANHMMDNRRAYDAVFVREDMEFSR